MVPHVKSNMHDHPLYKSQGMNSSKIIHHEINTTSLKISNTSSTIHQKITIEHNHQIRMKETTATLHLALVSSYRISMVKENILPLDLMEPKWPTPTVLRR